MTTRHDADEPDLSVDEAVPMGLFLDDDDLDWDDLDEEEALVRLAEQPLAIALRQLR